MRRGLALLLVASAVAAVAFALWRPAPRGNIVLLVVDTLRADALGCYGGANATPVLDALASRGTRFAPMASSFHQTSASMGAMFTGATPGLEDTSGDFLEWNGRNWCGMARFATGDEKSRCLPVSIPTLGERMKAAGYRTVGVVGNNLLWRPAGFDRGFDVWREVGRREPKRDEESLAAFARDAALSRAVDGIAEEAVAALDGEGGQPLFLYLHFMDVHDWWVPGDASRSLRHVANYGRSVEGFDTGLGRLLAALEERGILDGATVVLTADHGESLGESHPVPCMPSHDGNPTYESVASIPLVIAGPGGAGLAATLARSPLLRTQDVPRLLLALAGAEVPAAVGPLQDDEVFYTERYFRTLRRGTDKLVCPRQAGAACALYDLAADPAETVDVSDRHADLAAGLRARIEELSVALRSGAGEAAAPGLTEQDRQRLQALGYLQ